MSQEPADKPKDAWGDAISEERQAELQGILDAWNAAHGDRKGPFDRVSLTGADAFWLAERVRNQHGLVPNLHLERAILSRAHLDAAILQLAHLEVTSLHGACLSTANLSAAHLE